MHIEKTTKVIMSVPSKREGGGYDGGKPGGGTLGAYIISCKEWNGNIEALDIKNVFYAKKNQYIYESSMSFTCLFSLFIDIFLPLCLFNLGNCE